MEQTFISVALAGAIAGLIYVLALLIKSAVNRIEKPEPVSARQQVVEKRRAIEADAGKPFATVETLLDLVGWMTPVLTAKSAIALMVLKGAKTKIDMRTSKMPRSWLDAAVNEASSDGKAYLGKHLSDDGLISAHHAHEWAILEEGLSRKQVYVPNKAEREVRQAYEQSKPLEQFKRRTLNALTEVSGRFRRKPK